MKLADLQQGLTVLEVLVTVVIFSVVSAVLFSVFAATARNFSYTTKTVSLQTDLAATLNVFLDDVELTGFAGYTTSQYNPSGFTTAAEADRVTDTRVVIPPGTALDSVTLNLGTNGNPPDSIRFIADVARSGSQSPDGRPDRITYQVTNGNLTRTIELGDTSGGYTNGTTTDTVAANVTGFQLRLYDQTHTSLTAANKASTCYVGATVYAADTNVRGGIPLSKALSGEAALRNFASLLSCTN